MTEFTTATPRIAVYILLQKDGKYAFVKRANTGWRDGFYGLPAGKVEKNESFVQAAIREANEEVGVSIDPSALHHVLTSHRYEDGSDWVDVVFTADNYTGEARNAEPHMHSELAWLDLHNLPETVNPTLHLMLDAYVLGEQFVEIGWPDTN